MAVGLAIAEVIPPPTIGRDLLLGSVSQRCANHAGCPVVVVRHLHPNG